MSFDFIPAEVPTKRNRTSKYATTVEKFVESGIESCQVDMQNIKLNTAYAGFKKAILSKYHDKVAVSRIGGGLYLERI